MEGYTKIGRIRPNYTGTWNAETAYTVLEMVKNEAGTASYIAKQDVPAGTPLTDETYWAMVLDAGDVIAAAEKAADDAHAAAEAANAAREGVEDDLNSKAPAIVQTATGSVIAAGDASDMPLKGLKLFGKTTQDGTPTPETPIPLVSVGESGSVGVSVCGKNLLDLSKAHLSNCVMDGENVRLNVVDKTYAEITFSDNISALRSGMSITFSVKKGMADKRLSIVLFGSFADGKTYKEVSGANGSRTVTMHIDDFYTVSSITLRVGRSDTKYTDTTTTFEELQLEINATSTPYEPGKPAQNLTAQTPNGLPGIPVTSGGNYTDASGQQWVCDEIDLERGVYVQRIKELIFDGVTSGRMMDDTDEQPAGKTHVYAYIKSSTLKDFVLNSKAMCTVGGIGTSTVLSLSMPIDYLGLVSSNAEESVIVNAMNTKLKEMYDAGEPAIAKYILDKPIKTALSAEEIAQYKALHTNYPNTTIYNDAGADMEVNYVADTKLYIDNKFAAMQEAIINA